jgi:ribosomal protein L11 methyltransferase
MGDEAGETCMRKPDRWFVLTAHVAADDPLRDLLGEGLLALGGLSVLDEGEALTTYLEPPSDGPARLLEVERFLAEWLADDAPELTWRWQANEDWEREWRKGLRPRKVSRRVVVKPTWTDWAAAPGEVVIEIDPQMAFGTGEHATTRGCLRLLDGAIREGDRVLDVGSGSAILSIAAALLGAARVTALEYDADANVNARENIERNGVGERIELREEMADPPLLATFGTFDLVLANILSSVIRPLLPTFASALTDGGRLIVSGILSRERDEVVDDARAAGFILAAEDGEEEWWSALFERGPASG